MPLQSRQGGEPGLHPSRPLRREQGAPQRVMWGPPLGPGRSGAVEWGAAREGVDEASRGETPGSPSRMAGIGRAREAAGLLRL